jgi:hypothetical protein
MSENNVMAWEHLAREINNEIYSQLEDNEVNHTPVIICSDGNEVFITFFDIPIWSSDNDDRPTDENGDQTIPVGVYVRNEIMRHVSIISKIKLS